MANILFDVDDLLSDVQSLKLSALRSAARITPFVTCRTLGPNIDENNKDADNLTETSPKIDITFTTNNESGKKFEWTSPNGADSGRSVRKVAIADCEALSYKMFLQDAEKQRLAKIKKDLTARHARFLEADKIRYEKYNELMKDAQKTVVDKILESEQRVLEALEAQEKIAKEEEDTRQAALREESQRLFEITQQIKKQDEERKLKHMRIESLRNQNSNFKNMTDVFTKTLETLDKELAQNFSIQKKNVSTLVKYFEQLLQSVNARREINQSDVDKATEICKQMEVINGEVVDIITKLTEKFEKENQEKLDKEKLEAQQKTETAPADTVDTTNPPTTVAVPQSAADQLSSFVSKESLEFYMKIKFFYEQHQTSVKQLLDDSNMKTYRFNCQKAINIPVNAISAANRQHFLDKYLKLASLLAGNSVKAGETQVSINEHPLGKTYCTLLLAKKFVSQADTMISSNLPAAFPIAAIVVALWQKFPDFGTFFLAYIHKECPYLVPYFLPQIQGQSPEDYFKCIGYRIVDGVLEQQDKYLKRMTGLARLYAAVLVTTPRTEENLPHPHNLDYGWKWLCNILNLEPLPDICATLLLEFLQITGYEMWSQYGKQFIKVLKLIQEQYLPKLNKVDEGGPKARLEGLIISIMKEGKIARQEGMLSPNFW